MKKTVKKIPYIMIWIIIGVGCLVREVFPKGFLWAGVLLYVATGITFVIGRLRKNTTWYHTYIGWAWLVPTILFAHIDIADIYTNWDYMFLLPISACIATAFTYIWINDKSVEHEAYSLVLYGAAILVLTLAITACPKMINSSKIISTEFRTIEVVDKRIETYWRSWENEVYHLQLEEDELIYSDGFSKEYYDSIQIGDEIPVCIYTGILGKQFYSFFEDPNEDFYGYNRWTREEYQKYLSEPQNTKL